MVERHVANVQTGVRFSLAARVQKSALFGAFSVRVARVKHLRALRGESKRICIHFAHFLEQNI